MSSAGHILLIAVFASCLVVFADASPSVLTAQFSGAAALARVTSDPTSGIVSTDSSQSTLDAPDSRVEVSSQSVPAASVSGNLAGRASLVDVNPDAVISLLSPSRSSQFGEQPHRGIVTGAPAGFSGAVQETLVAAWPTKVDDTRSGDNALPITKAFVRTLAQSQHEELTGHPTPDHRGAPGDSSAPATSGGPLYADQNAGSVQAPAIQEPESLFLLGTALLAAGFGARLIKRSADRRTARRRVPTSTP